MASPWRGTALASAYGGGTCVVSNDNRLPDAVLRPTFTYAQLAVDKDSTLAATAATESTQSRHANLRYSPVASRLGPRIRRDDGFSSSGPKLIARPFLLRERGPASWAGCCYRGRQ